MFRRSYDIEYKLSEKKMFLSDVLMTLEIAPYAVRRNQRPYDRFKNEQVKTLHYVVRYGPKEEHREKVERVRRHFMGQ